MKIVGLKGGRERRGRSRGRRNGEAGEGRGREQQLEIINIEDFHGPPVSGHKFCVNSLSIKEKNTNFLP